MMGGGRFKHNVEPHFPITAMLEVTFRCSIKHGFRKAMTQLVST